METATEVQRERMYGQLTDAVDLSIDKDIYRQMLKP
ncbi:serine proteinase protein 1b, partial [Danaus plexippus plexippus]